MGWGASMSFFDIVDGFGLVVGLLEAEALLQAPRELAVGAEGKAGHGLTGGVEGEQLAGHLGDRLAGPSLTADQAAPPRRFSCGGAPLAPM